MHTHTTQPALTQHAHTHHTASSNPTCTHTPQPARRTLPGGGLRSAGRATSHQTSVQDNNNRQNGHSFPHYLIHPPPRPRPAPSPAQQRVAAQTSAEINAQPIPPEHQGRYGNRSTNTNRLANIVESPSGPAPSHQYVAARCLLLRTTLNKHLTASRTAEEGRGRGVAGGGGE